MENGKIKIVNGQIIVIDPIDSGKNATIVPAEIGKLYVNGKIKKEETPLKEKDVVEYELINEEPLHEVKINISSDKMKVYLSLLCDSGKSQRLQDSDETERLVVNVVEEEIKSKIFTKEEIINKLNAQEIIFGIKTDVIDEIIKNQKAEDVLIVEGEYAIDAEDDELIFNKKEEENDEKDPMDIVDYKNINKIECVLAGESIGTIKRGFPAQKGTNIYGKNVNAKKNKQKTIKNGNGCEITADNIIASVNGQVSYKNGLISVHKLYTIEKDVDISTGNINFNGDVKVNGNIAEGMKVIAYNDVFVSGSVYSSTVISKGDITIKKSVIDSMIVSGGTDITKEERAKTLVKINEDIKGILSSVKFLSKDKNFHMMGKINMIVKGLIDTKFKDFNKNCNELIKLSIKDNEASFEIIKFLRGYMMRSAINTIESIDQIESVKQLIEEEIQSIEEVLKQHSTINVEYCQEAKIQSAGDVVISGKGIFSTDVYASGSVVFSNKAAVCRGGVLRAGNKIEAAIVGSEAGAQTVIEVFDKKGKINIDRAYTNTLIIINNIKHLINSPSRNVYCYIDSKGELIVEKLSL